MTEEQAVEMLDALWKIRGWLIALWMVGLYFMVIEMLDHHGK